ncbi:hypothetical protein IPZ58_07680 [Streptomyces roseoverticillatus]|uniref:hypothetical protein n=1 Tax=Streptomyces roseoverticillatus TaxID=66429 RepID=UPI001F2E7B57|nr:hypothetical protein [Streptomyces roseoverticillatus]MCF3101459.1 hypothetical protein [Streptomyces roseoverticillatus]
MNSTAPAAVLRAAATKLRDLATAAAQSSGDTRWQTAHGNPNWHGPRTPLYTATSPRNILRAQVHGRATATAYVHTPVGEYIAAMSPALGPLLAAWLEKTADSIDAHGEATAWVWSAGEPDAAAVIETGPSGAQHALAVAHHLLGDADGAVAAIGADR